MHPLHNGVDHGNIDPGTSMDMSANMTTTEGGMSSTFSTWDSYKLQLLFSGWNISERWQFALTWFAVLLAAMSLHILDCLLVSLRNSMITILKSEAQEISDVPGSNAAVAVVTTDLVVQKTKRPIGWQAVKIIHGLLSGMKYGLSLLLMLVAMTFNPSLFLALVIGYLVGDYVCCDFHIDMKIGVYNTPRGGLAGPFLHKLLCMKETSDRHEIISLIHKAEA